MTYIAKFTGVDGVITAWVRGPGSRAAPADCLVHAFNRSMAYALSALSYTVFEPFKTFHVYLGFVVILISKPALNNENLTLVGETTRKSN